MIMKEEWRGVIYQGKDYSDKYEVSNLGRFRNAKTKRIIKQTINKTGYYGYCATLGQKNKYKLFKIHRAVAESFIPNPNNYPMINHIDGNKLNNCVNNLEWCTNKYNIHHAMNMGLLDDNLKKLKELNIQKAKGVKATNIKTQNVIKFKSITEASNFLGDEAKRRHITEVANNKRKTAYGYIWEWI